MDGEKDRTKPLYHVVSAAGGSMEVLPVVRIRQSPTDERGDYHSAVPIEHDALLKQQNAYRIHFSIIDKSRSWMRGSKRSFRWYETALVCLHHGCTKKIRTIRESIGWKIHCRGVCCVLLFFVTVHPYSGVFLLIIFLSTNKDSDLTMSA
jgi:hypothetical protein